MHEAAIVHRIAVNLRMQLDPAKAPVADRPRHFLSARVEPLRRLDVRESQQTIRIRVHRVAGVVVRRSLIEADVGEAVHDDREIDAPFVHQVDDVVDLELAIAFLE